VGLPGGLYLVVGAWGLWPGAGLVWGAPARPPPPLGAAGR
jgi:hypothetical protein